MLSPAGPHDPAGARDSPGPAAARRNPVGSHVKVGRSLVAGAVATADRLGAEAIQVFAGNPRGWAHAPGAPDQDAAFREACASRGLRVFVHAPYLVNLGSPTPETYQRSVASVAHHLSRAARLGAEGLVVHTGSCVADGAVDAAMAQIRAALLPLLDTLAEDDHETSGAGLSLLLEPTAGQGRSLCAGVEDLGGYLDALDHHPRAGVCLDTCHVFAAGAPLEEPGGTAATLDRLEEVAGPGRLRLVHANDSRDTRGSMRDRHARLGEGPLGEQAFVEAFTHPSTAGVPFVLETPKSGEPGDDQILRLQRLRP